ncbi:MAG: hypothetical protein COU65_00265 [Candidatus Pacebacteria bacterium CG10_big_fil_rev_8_21_14_0_10_42_12]|nr:undecaprenyl/decaprenyl-phosphate alpha-N-acetylglucosaminyl 1-phosphate transferase [Candidatus Paceibacterota bacterium]PIR63009.1 MAG: hypothetical protein COU65_00265 [Candidatus Pacebacteria bacterium CG10_big_fil_rev_8_21_14_0_10_42_12]
MYPIIISFVLAFTITPIVIMFYKRRGWVDDPKKNKHAKTTHKSVVPRGGGLAIFLSVLLASVISLQFDKYLVAILLGALILTISGILDDIFDLHPIPRLLANIAAALLVVGSGIGIAYVSNPFTAGVIHLNQPQLVLDLFGKTRSIWILADLFAVVFIVWNINIVNWAKGVDGQMPGFVTAAFIFIGILSTKFNADPTSFNTTNLAFILAGAFAGLLIWNWYPQKIMPGYGAGSLAGYFLSVLAILSGAKLATALMVLCVPTADAIFTIARRIYAGKSPLWGDRGHLHHKLLDEFGWSRQQIAVFYWAASIGLGILSLYLNTFGKLITIATTMGLVFGLLIWVKVKKSTQ